MTPLPAKPPHDDNIHEWKDYALGYLSEQLRKAAPSVLAKPVVFPRSPLDGEGATVIFEFAADRADRGEAPYFVVVGQTESNYYPRYDLHAEEAFELHLGTRFMLVMGVAQVDGAAQSNQETKPYDPEEDVRRIVSRVAPDKPVDAIETAATFDVDGQLHTVLRGTIAGEAVYIMGRDAPPGFSRRVDLPPQVAYRLHIGHVLRLEPDHEDENRE